MIMLSAKRLFLNIAIGALRCFLRVAFAMQTALRDAGPWPLESLWGRRLCSALLYHAVLPGKLILSYWLGSVLAARGRLR